jgi:hypothetical protein
MMMLIENNNIETEELGAFIRRLSESGLASAKTHSNFVDAVVRFAKSDNAEQVAVLARAFAGLIQQERSNEDLRPAISLRLVRQISSFPLVHGPQLLGSLLSIYFKEEYPRKKVAVISVKRDITAQYIREEFPKLAKCRDTELLWRWSSLEPIDLRDRILKRGFVVVSDDQTSTLDREYFFGIDSRADMLYALSVLAGTRSRAKRPIKVDDGIRRAVDLLKRLGSAMRQDHRFKDSNLVLKIDDLAVSLEPHVTSKTRNNLH